MDENQGTLNFWVEAFLLDCRIRQNSPSTIIFYRMKLRKFTDWCNQEDINTVWDLSPNYIRLFMVFLEDTGHNPGGRHAYYRTVKTFLNFIENEEEPTDWRNPVKKVKAPRVPERPIDPVSIEQVSSLIRACDTGAFYGCRDKAIFLVLLETGCRASELLDINLEEDVNLIEGSIQIRKGKNSKVRTVFFGKKCKTAVRHWVMRKRSHNAIPLFCTMSGERLTYSGLRQILRRRSKDAGISGVSLHDFRRANCLSLLNQNIPETTIARLLGHATTSLIATYAKQSNHDLRQAFYSIGDHEL